MNKKEKQAIEKAIYESEDSYELHLREWAKRCLDTIKSGVEKQQKELENSISKDKIREKIVEYKNLLMCCNRFSDVDRIKSINERILAYEELLKESNKDVN